MFPQHKMSSHIPVPYWQYCNKI